jgi:phage terminase large subunit
MTQPTVFEISPDEYIETFRPYLTAEQGVQLFVGTAASGKSMFLYQRAVTFCLAKKYFRCLLTRKVKDTIRDSIFLGIKDVIDKWNLKPYFSVNESQMDIICRVNGNMMLSFGLDDPDKLKSIKDPSHVLADEFDAFSKEDFAELRRRLRTQRVKKPQFWGAFNPVPDWWGREYFFADPEADQIPVGEVPAAQPDTLIHKSTYHHNPHVDQEDIKQKNLELSALDENNWTVYELGDWGKVMTGAEFYHQFKRRHHVGEYPFLPDHPVHSTWDFNVLPYMTHVLGQVTKEVQRKDDGKPLTIYTIRVFREYCLEDPQNTTEACANAYLEEFGRYQRDLIIYGDAMGNKRHEGQGNKTEFKFLSAIFAKYLDQDRTNRSNPSVLQSRKFMNKILAEQEIAPGILVRIRIDKSCKKLISDFEHVKLGVDGILKERYKDPKTGQTWEKWGHASDAIRYMVVKLFEDIFKTFTS